MRKRAEIPYTARIFLNYITCLSYRMVDWHYFAEGLNEEKNDTVLNGEKIKFLITVSELEEDYSLGEKKDTANELGYIIDWHDLIYKSEVIGSVWIINDAEQELETCSLCGISIEKAEFSINGISIGQNIDIVFKQWGEPSDTIELRTKENIYKSILNPTANISDKENNFLQSRVYTKFETGSNWILNDEHLTN